MLFLATARVRKIFRAVETSTMLIATFAALAASTAPPTRRIRRLPSFSARVVLVLAAILASRVEFLSVALVSESLVLSFRLNVVSSQVSFAHFLHKIVLVKNRNLLHLKYCFKEFNSGCARFDSDKNLELCLFSKELDVDLSLFMQKNFN